ncbi:MAG: hypothetical protein QM765_31455 [Myxococcales bacterium]
MGTKPTIWPSTIRHAALSSAFWCISGRPTETIIPEVSGASFLSDASARSWTPRMWNASSQP